MSLRVLAVAFVLPLVAVGAAGSPRKATLLELQRLNRRPALFAGPANQAVNITGFCRRIGCDPEVEGSCAPVCTTKPCCCWSTFAADQHPFYPSPEEVRSKQICHDPPPGFLYAPEPGLTYNDGYVDALKRAGLPVYDGRRLCCLRRAAGPQEDSQRDLRMAVPTTSTTTVTTTEAKPPEIYEPVDPVFTTEPPPTTSLLNPGDEYENAQMEEAAQKHLEAAESLQDSVSALNASAVAVQEINDKLQTDPNLVRSRKHVAEMRSAIHDWALRRWVNLNRLKTGDASAFDSVAAPPAPSDVAAPPGLSPEDPVIEAEPVFEVASKA